MNQRKAKRNGIVGWADKSSPMDKQVEMNRREQALAILKGKCVGGPLEGVQVDASPIWDGRLEGHDNGHYVWCKQAEAWTWRGTFTVRRRVGRPKKPSAKGSRK